jgi:hypothetical protein
MHCADVRIALKLLAFLYLNADPLRNVLVLNSSPNFVNLAANYNRNSLYRKYQSAFYLY